MLTDENRVEPNLAKSGELYGYLRQQLEAQYANFDSVGRVRFSAYHLPKTMFICEGVGSYEK